MNHEKISLPILLKNIESNKELFPYGPPPEYSIITKRERKNEDDKVKHFNELQKMEIGLRFNLRKWEELKELKKKNPDKYEKEIVILTPFLDELLFIWKNHEALSYLEKKSIQPAWKRISEYFKYKANNYIFYPSINARDFYEKLYKKKEFYINRQIKLNLTDIEDKQKELCPSKNKNFKLQSHQKLMKTYLSINTPFNGALIFHGTGSGKTCSSITIAESYKNLISLNGKRMLVILSKSVKSNFVKEIHDITKGYNQCTNSDYLNYEIYASDDKKKKNVFGLIDKYYELKTYGKFRSAIKKRMNDFNILDYNFTDNNPPPSELIKWIDLYYSDRVIIVDEVHNLKSHREIETIDELEELEEVFQDMEENTDNLEMPDMKDFKPYHALELILKHSQNVKLILLSATPMYHHPNEIVSVLNLLLVNDNYNKLDPKDIFDVTKGNYKLTENGSNILRITSQGYISYIRTENPNTFAKRKYPKSITIHEYFNKKLNKLKKKYGIKKIIKNDDYIEPIKIILCEMSKEHYKFYRKHVTSGETVGKLIEYGNIAKADLKNNPNKITLRDLQLSSLLDPDRSISTKLGTLVSNIITNIINGTYFVFSYYNPYGTLIIARALLQNGVSLAMVNKRGGVEIADKKNLKHILGHSWEQPSREKQINYNGKTREENKKKGSIFKPMKFAYIVGRIEEDQRDSLTIAFNDDENTDGSSIKIMIGSGVFREGISLLNVRQIHLFEPWHNRSRLEQVIGRGLRHCSHKRLKKNERYVNIYQYASVHSSIDDINISDRNYINDIMRNFTKKSIINPREIKSDLVKYGFYTWDVIMYMRSQILHNLINDIQIILKETAVDCLFNIEGNINTLKEEKKYKCFKKISSKRGKIKYFSNKDLELDEEVLDYSTFDEFFYQPYITYVINVIKKLFENNKNTFVLTFDEILHNENFIDNIYFERNNFIIRSALYDLVPKQSTDLRTFPHIIKKNVGRRIIHGYIFGRNTEKGGIFIFQPFEDQSAISNITKDLKRSDFERSPMYEKVEFEQTISVPLSFSDIFDKEASILFYGKSSSNKSKKKKRKVIKVTELIKDRDISLSNETEKNKNASLLGIILNVTELENINDKIHLWGLEGFHIWFREFEMICKRGTRESIGQHSLSFNVKQLQCMINQYLLTEKLKKIIDTKVILKMLRDTNNTKALKFATDIEVYNDIYEWWRARIEDQNSKKKRFKLILKKQDYSNLIYIILLYFESKKMLNKIWLRRL